MPSVRPSSAQSRGLGSDLPTQQRIRDRTRHRAPQLPAELARFFRNPDAAEAFMWGWLTRFHGECPGLYTVLAARRTDVKVRGVMRRLVIEAAKFQPQRRGASPEWLLICWCIDGPGVVFHRCPTSAVALQRLRDELAESAIVFSLIPAATAHVNAVA